MDNNYTDQFGEIDTALFGLVKVGKKEHLEELQKGKLRFRTLSYYKRVESKLEQFHDENEGLIDIRQADTIQLSIVPSNRPRFTLNAANGLVGQVIISVHKPASVFCLSAIHSGEWTNKTLTDANKSDYQTYLQLTDEVKGFGDSVWAITKGDEFNTRLLEACQRKNLQVRSGFVRYVDRTKFNGFIPDHLVGFVKLDKFSQQREYRYLLEPKEPLPDPFVLDVGDLNDVSIITPVDDFRIEIEPLAETEKGVNDGGNL